MINFGCVKIITYILHRQRSLAQCKKGKMISLIAEKCFMNSLQNTGTEETLDCFEITVTPSS